MPTNIISVLRTEHREVTKLFEILEKTTSRSARRRLELFAEIDASLRHHAEFEEKHVYPLLTAKKISMPTALEAIEEHAQVKRLLTDLRPLDAPDERWMAKIMVLMEDVRHHVKEEEGEMFGQLRKSADEKQLADLAAKYETFKATPNPEESQD